MKKYIVFALIALGMVSMAGCRHHHRPDHDRPDYRRDRDYNHNRHHDSDHRDHHHNDNGPDKR